MKDSDKHLIPDKEQRNIQADEIGRKLYGKNWTSIITALEEVEPKFAEFIKEIPYGSIYPRKILSLEMREIASITSLTHLNLEPQLKSHLIAARRLGISKEEIVELFLHISMYIGFPLVLDGLKVAKEVFEREDEVD